MPSLPALWRDPAPLVLASTSPTRRALLEATGIPFVVERPAVDERALEAGLAGAAPQALAEALARAKALDVSRRRPESLTIGADQTLDLAGRALHKPDGRAGAAAQLAAMAGRRHALCSAVAIARGGEVAAAFVEGASLAMRPLDADAIERYLDLAGPSALASVGAYQLEGLGAHLFETVEGAHATVLGLPVLPLLAALRRLGALAL